jgi:hypothetical protein
MQVDSCEAFDFGGQNPACSPNVLEQAKTNGDLSLAVSFFEVTGLMDMFDCAGEFTLLLPVNGKNGCTRSGIPTLLNLSTIRRCYYCVGPGSHRRPVAAAQP